MKRKKSSKYHRNSKKSNSNEDTKELDEVGTYHEFLVFEKTGESNAIKHEFIKCDHDNLFLKDWLILQSKPEIKESRFSNLFKEIKENDKILAEKEKEKDKENDILEKTQMNGENTSEINRNAFESLKEIEFNDIEHLHSKTFSNKNTIFNEGENLDFSYPNNYFPYRIQNSLDYKNSTYMNSSYYGRSTNDSGYADSFSNNSSININSNERKSNISSKMKNNYKYYNDVIVDIKRVISLEDKRTSIMIKNIPNKFTKDILLHIIDQNFSEAYDIFILPIDMNKNKNFGYAFINFISSYYIPNFYYMFNGKKWSNTNSEKICEITYSKIQGKSNLILHYPTKSVFQNDVKQVNAEQKYVIPNDYLLLFKKAFPQQCIEESKFYFITKMPSEH